MPSFPMLNCKTGLVVRCLFRHLCHSRLPVVHKLTETIFGFAVSASLFSEKEIRKPENVVNVN
jgi:hypothetical protein